MERDLLVLSRVDTLVNMLDHLTKQLGPTLFHRHVEYHGTDTTTLYTMVP